MNKFSFSVLLSVVTIAVVVIFFGISFENSERFSASVAYGNIADPPYRVWFKDVWLFQIPVIVFLSEFFEKVPVFGIWVLMITVAYLSLWFHLAIRISGRLIRTKLVRLLVAFMFVWAIVGTSMICVYNLRQAVLLASSSLLLFLDYYIYEDRRPVSLILLFLFACMIRFEGVFFVLIPITVLAAVYYRSPLKLFHLLKFQWLSLILCLLAVKAADVIENSPATRIEARYEYAICDMDAMVPLSEMKTATDSVKYTAVKRYFVISDSAAVNISFLSRVVDKGKYFNTALSQDDLRRFLNHSAPTILRYSEILLLLYLLFFTAIWQGGRIVITGFAVFNLLCWGIVLILGFKLRTYLYFFVPWLAFTFGGTLWIIGMRRRVLTIWQKAVFFSLLSLAFAYQIKDMKNVADQQYFSERDAISELKKIETLSKTTVPLIWTSDDGYLTYNIFDRNVSEALQKCVSLNLSYLFYSPWASNRCVKRLGFSPLDWKNMGLTFIKDRKKLCFIMEDSFAQFVPYYYKNVYGINFKLVRNYPVQEIVPGNYVYHVEVE